MPDDAYADGVTAGKAVETLRRLAGRPFFLAVGFLKPHLPFVAPQRYWELYRREAMAVPAQRDWPAGMPDLAGTNWGELRNYAGIPGEGPLPHALARELIHGYYACVSYLDAQVGRVIAELDRLGLREETAIVLLYDHGQGAVAARNLAGDPNAADLARTLSARLRAGWWAARPPATAA